MSMLPLARRCAVLLVSLLLFAAFFLPGSIDTRSRDARERASTTTSPEAAPPLPVAAAPLSTRSLSQCIDTNLQLNLEAALSRPEWSALIDRHDMAVGVVDLADPKTLRYAAVNGTDMMYAASLPKIGILYAAERQIERGRLSPSPAVTRDLNAMIRASSNAAATRMIDRVGGLAAVNRALTEAPAFYDRERSGGIWVGKRFSSDTRRQPDPLQGISHAATVHQVARFYTLVATGALINRARSAEMLDILSNPGLNHKFVHSLRERAPNASIYRKSGSWRHWHADSALVWGPDRRYVIVALVSDPDGETIIRSVLPAVEKALDIPASTATS